MKKENVIRAGLFLLALLLALTACAQREPGDTTAGLTSPTEATVPETAPATEPPLIDPAETVIPTAENVAELLEKAKERWPGLGVSFPYLEAAIRGEIDLSKPKLTLEKLREICAESENFEEVKAAINKMQPPDCVHGSGIVTAEYWGYGDGTISISIIADAPVVVLERHRIDDQGRAYEVVARKTIYPQEGGWYDPYIADPVE
ncbi:MAG: hypothetical protein IJR89_07380 [Clostridia bacterium]|nr:hypothetical protein [Clostridia bacterium]